MDGVRSKSSTDRGDADRTATLAASLLQAPLHTDPQLGSRWAYRRWMLLFMSLVVGYHALVLLVHNLPGGGLSKDLHKFFNEKLQASTYMRATGNSQSWAMFAPDPHRSNMFMRVFVEDKEGELWDLAHDIYGRRTYPYLFYDRMGKINRRLIEEKGYRRHYAAWVCREWEMTHGGEAPEEVRFRKMWTQVPAPEKVYPYGGYDPMTLPLHTTDEETVRCSSSYHGQLPPEIRERLGFPEVDANRFRDVNIRTWWDDKEAKVKAQQRADDNDDAVAPEPAGEVEGAKEL